MSGRSIPGLLLHGQGGVARLAELLVGRVVLAVDGAGRLSPGLHLACNRVVPNILHASLWGDGRGCSCSVAGSVSQGPRELVPSGVSRASRSGGGHLLGGVDPAGSDRRVPAHASGDDHPQLAQQGGGKRRAGLVVRQRVGRAGGEAAVAGGQDRVVGQGAPDRPSGRHAQQRPAASGRSGWCPGRPRRRCRVGTARRG
jgi:hypothetical protein